MKKFLTAALILALGAGAAMAANLNDLKSLFNGKRTAADEQRTMAEKQIRSIEDALDMYWMHNGFYPSTQQGLEALVTAPATSPVPKRYPDGGYMKRIPDDPWGNPYVYRNENGRVKITSYGPDGKEGGEGINADITNED